MAVQTILIVDDEAAVTFSLEGYFRQKGYEVLKAFDGKQALERIQDRKPSMVILDLQMPRLDGIRVLEVLKAESPRTKTLVMTGFAEQYRSELDRLGVNRVEQKPVSLERLTDAVQALLDSQRGRPAAATRSREAGGTLRVLFVEGSPRVYENILKPYFEAPERSVRCQTALAQDPEGMFRLLDGFRPHVAVVIGTRMPPGIDAGKLAAQLTQTEGQSRPREVILHEIASALQPGSAELDRQLRELERAIRGVSHAAQ